MTLIQATEIYYQTCEALVRAHLKTPKGFCPLYGNGYVQGDGKWFVALLSDKDKKGLFEVSIDGWLRKAGKSVSVKKVHAAIERGDFAVEIHGLARCLAEHKA